MVPLEFVLAYDFYEKQKNENRKQQNTESTQMVDITPKHGW